MNAVASPAGAGMALSPSITAGSELRGLTKVAGAWELVAHSGTGWRGVLTCVRGGLYRIAAHYPGDEGALLRRLGDFIARPAEKWRDSIENLVVNSGLDYLLDAGLSGGSQITNWYLGLTDGTPTVAGGDTPASHAGWVEVTAYDEANRIAFADAGVSGQSLNNSASPAVFTINADTTTIGGAFLISENTKGGATGTLYSAGAFGTGDKLLDDNDQLTVTATFTTAAA